jgi:hypothetical protein
VAEGQSIRRPDIVLFVNGLPLAHRAESTARRAPRSGRPSIVSRPTRTTILLAFNELLASPTGSRRLGRSRPTREAHAWRTIEGAEGAGGLQLEVLSAACSSTALSRPRALLHRV